MLRPKARRLLSVIGRTNGEEEEECTSWVGLCALGAALGSRAGQGKGHIGNRGVFTAQYLGSSFFSSFLMPQAMRSRMKDIKQVTEVQGGNSDLGAHTEFLQDPALPLLFAVRQQGYCS